MSSHMMIIIRLLSQWPVLPILAHTMEPGDATTMLLRILLPIIIAMCVSRCRSVPATICKAADFYLRVQQISTLLHIMVRRIK